jgi:adenosine deaminase
MLGVACGARSTLTVPLIPSTVTTSPSRRRWVASTVATTAGMPRPLEEEGERVRAGVVGMRCPFAGLGIEIHAGEQAGPESVWDALEHGRPDRLGHGVRAFEDARLVERLCQRGVHLEFCLTSNLCLGVVSALQEHPLGRARALGMSFSISTDDPGPFGCSMESEMKLANETFALAGEDRAQIRKNAWRARFGRAATMVPP